jgi:hypothetical protein
MAAGGSPAFSYIVGALIFLLAICVLYMVVVGLIPGAGDTQQNKILGWVWEAVRLILVGFLGLVAGGKNVQ